MKQLDLAACMDIDWGFPGGSVVKYRAVQETQKTQV